MALQLMFNNVFLDGYWSSGKSNYYIVCSFNSNQFTFVTDLLFIEEDIILELPSFNRSDCCVPSFPVESYVSGVTGLVSGNLTACVQGLCWSLTAGAWTPIANMSVPRGNYSAASNSSQGWMVTGGLDNPADYEYKNTAVKNRFRLDSSEVLTNGAWSAGLTLPTYLYAHCQLQVAETVFILGSPLIKLYNFQNSKYQFKDSMRRCIY